MTVTADRLREVVDYDLQTGEFTRRVRLAQRHKVGDRADFIVTGGGLAGYRRVSLDSKRYLAHRLAWLHVYGQMPLGEIDHINGDPSDNRIANLRDVPRVVNAENVRRPRATNQSGRLGVYWHKGCSKWRARIQVRGKGISLGLFDDADEAHCAYVEAKRRLHQGCAI